jgi:hypothetical protein
MTTFDKIIMAAGGAATAIAGTAVAGDMPKWVALTCIGVMGACGALSPSLIASKRPQAIQADPAAPGKETP